MKLKFDIRPRKSSLCKTANCPSSSRALPRQQMGNAWQLIQLGDVLRALHYTALIMINVVLKVENMPLRGGAWLQLSGVINPGAHAFGGTAGGRWAGCCCAEGGKMQVCARATRMLGLALGPAVTQSPRPGPEAGGGTSSRGRDVLFRLPEEMCGSHQDGQAEVLQSHVQCWALSSCLSQTRCKGLHGFILRDTMHKTSREKEKKKSH